MRNSIRTRAGKSTGWPSRFAGLNLICCAARIADFIEAVAQSTYDAIYLHGAVREEHHVDHHVSFYLKTTPFRCVLRLRFVQDVNRRVCWSFALPLFSSVHRRYRLVSKSRRLHFSLLAAARRRICDSVSKTRARHSAANSFVAAGAISIARSARQCRLNPAGSRLVACFGSPLPAIPFGSPNPPVCTFSTGAFTVAGAALPEPILFSFTSSFGRFG